MIANDTKFSVPVNVFFKKSASGNLVLANAEDDDFSILELEGSATDIWEKFVKGDSFKTIYLWMGETFDGELDQMKADLEELVEDLVSKGYLNKLS